MNTISAEGIAKINSTSKLVLRMRGDSAVEFYNAAHRLYVLHLIEVAEIGEHRVEISTFLFFKRKILLGFRFSTQRHRDAE